MKIKLKYAFVNEKSHNENVKHFNDLSFEEKKLFINFLKDILNCIPLYGKNKSSAQLPQIKNHSELKNYAILLNNNFYHYHLGKDFSLNPILSYRFYDPKLLISQEIKFLNDIEKSGQFKTCDNLVNYQMIDDDIIIYNITQHNSWTELVNNLCIQGIPFDYTTCQDCGMVINNNNINCFCFNSIHNTTIGLNETISMVDSACATIIRYNETINELVINCLSNYNNFKKDVLIKSIEDLNKLFFI